jgi:hypothetical protein
MAATGATEYEPRRTTVALPLLQHGVASVVIMAPWYGTRAPVSQHGCYIETVADYLRQSLAIIVEGAAVLRWLGDGFRISAAEAYVPNMSQADTGSHCQRRRGLLDDKAVRVDIAATGFSWGE